MSRNEDIPLETEGFSTEKGEPIADAAREGVNGGAAAKADIVELNRWLDRLETNSLTQWK